MHQNISLLTLTVIATGAITARRLINFNGAHAGPGNSVLGVSCTDAKIDDPLACDVYGTALVEAGNAISKGQPLKVVSGGKVDVCASGSCIGYALTAASGGELVEVLLTPMSHVAGVPV